MLSAEKREKIQSILKFFKEEIESEYALQGKLDELKDGDTVLVLRSARVSTYWTLLEEVDKMNKRVHLYVLGEADEALAEQEYQNITVNYIETQGSF